jgi:S-adenosylmethionine decarboxylase
MQGTHLTADLQDCDPALPVMTDTTALRALCLQAVADAGLQAVGELFHHFPPPGGITGVVLLAESHLAVHTWPELGAVTVDVYVCNVGADNSSKARAVMAVLTAEFAGQECQTQQHVRGESSQQVPAAPT